MGTKLLSAGLKTFFLGGFLLWTVVPVVLVISNSFKTQLDIFSVPPTVFFVPTLENYVRALTAGDFGRYFLNSLFVGATSSLLSVITVCWSVCGGSSVAAVTASGSLGCSAQQEVSKNPHLVKHVRGEIA